MNPSKVSKAAGPKPAKPPRARAKITPVSTWSGTTQRMITYPCPHCGLVHRVIELGLRQAACHRGLVLVEAGGAR